MNSRSVISTTSNAQAKREEKKALRGQLREAKAEVTQLTRATKAAQREVDRLTKAIAKL